MTAITPAQIPSSCNTVEKLAVWALGLLQTINPNNAVLTETNVTQFNASAGAYKVADGTTVFSGSVIIPLDPLYLSNATKIWINAIDISAVALPLSYTTD
jgi:hypothetical protein